MRAVFLAGLSLVAGLGASAGPAEAQYYSYSRSSYSSSGYSTSLVKSDDKNSGRIVRGYYNRFGQVVATARANTADVVPAEADAAAAATTYDTGRATPRKTRRVSDSSAKR